MDLKAAMKEQYHAGMAMLRQCVELSPDDLWIAGEHPRSYWRIAFHTVYFTHLYLGQDEHTFEQWPNRWPDYYPELWTHPWSLEPYEMPEEAGVLSKEEILDYLNFVDSIIDHTVDGLDLQAPSTGFPWYPNMNKLSHEFMNIRHVQGHVGQLSELLMMRGIDIQWVAKA